MTAERAAVVRALVAEVPRQLAAEQDDRAALLARWAYIFDGDEGAFAAQVDDALRSALGAPVFGGRLPGPPFATGTAIAFDPDGRMVAAAGHDGSVRLWHLGHPTADPVLLSGEEPGVLAFDRTGQRLMGAKATQAGTGSVVWSWDLADPSGGSPEVSLPGLVRPLAIGPPGTTVAGWTTDHGLATWHIARPADPEDILAPDVARDLTAVSLGLDGESGVAVDPVGKVWVWGPDNVASLATTIDLAEQEPPIGSIVSAVLAPDGVLYVADRRGRVMSLAIDAAIGSPAVIVGPAGRVTALAVSADGSRLGSIGADDAVRVWELVAADVGHTRAPGPPLPDASVVSMVAFGGQGGTVAKVRDDGGVDLGLEDTRWRQVWASTEGGSRRIRHRPQSERRRPTGRQCLERRQHPLS